jgi:hypothetical protein
MVDSLVQRLLALDFSFVLVPLFGLCVEGIDIVVCSARFDMGDVGA